MSRGIDRNAPRPTAGNVNQSTVNNGGATTEQKAVVTGDNKVTNQSNSTNVVDGKKVESGPTPTQVQQASDGFDD